MKRKGMIDAPHLQIVQLREHAPVAIVHFPLNVEVYFAYMGQINMQAIEL